MNELTEPLCDLRLPLSGWSIRIARGADDRPALEVYDGPRLADVSVATALSVAFLRGAVRSRRRQRPWALAWGQLPTPSAHPTVAFSSRRGCHHAIPHIIEGTYWIAEAPGHFTEITITTTHTQTKAKLRRPPP